MHAILKGTELVLNNDEGNMIANIPVTECKNEDGVIIFKAKVASFNAAASREGVAEMPQYANHSKGLLQFTREDDAVSYIKLLRAPTLSDGILEAHAAVEDYTQNKIEEDSAE